MPLADQSIYDAVLRAEVANAVIVMVLFMLLTTIILARIFAPILKRHNDELSLLREAVSEDRASNQAQTESIRELRDDLDKHMISIQVRFDKLPNEIQSALGAEIARHVSNRSWLSRILGS